ncbi:hypothetical protein J7384_05650 [Endozoicomonas sp. G2_1]|uniref:sodium:solute symporter family protein n=1 Tax=Endozoicomonas sp. G2_1 TaxID=2821091 RepID=UPI001AD9544A|nr:hypothetical protein [Endozoicomonas sp. G2_1]MBO9489840.1 hypothetical protein [Endozoicomonas sp. G2_1]
MEVNNLLMAAPIALYVAFLIYVMARLQLGHEVESGKKFAIGSGNLRWKIIFATTAATMIGPAYSLAVVDKINSTGLYFVFFYLLATVQFFIFGKYFSASIYEKSRNSKTIGQLFLKEFNKPTQLFVGLITVAQALAIVGVLCQAGAIVLNNIFGIEPSWAIIGIAVCVGFYSTIGGMPAVIKTDIAQFGLLLLALIIGGIAIFQLPNTQPVNLSQLSSNLMVSDIEPKVLFGLCIAFLLGEALIPAYAIRGFIGKSAMDIRKGFYATGVFATFWFISLAIIGYLAVGTGLEGEGLLIKIVSTSFENDAIRSIALGILAVSFLGVIMSTLDSILNAGAVSLTTDVMANVFKSVSTDDINEQRKSVLVIAFLGIGFTAYSTDIVDILLLAYAIWVPTVLFPFAYLLLSKQPFKNNWSALIAMAMGIIGYNINDLLSLSWLPAILTGLVFNIVTLASIEKLASESRIKETD